MTAHVVVTGGAGFIGSHLCTRLCTDGYRVTCFDNLDDFYDPAIKQDNLRQLQQNPITADRLTFVRGDIRDLDTLHQFFQAESIDVIIHLAARAGVRPSIEQTLLYGDINVQGTLNLLECCRQYDVRHFVFGSSSSVYGERDQGPFSETDDVSMPVSPYAATKRAGELFCHTYSYLYAMRIACLRFFTVYGPGQRPDLAIHKFARLMSQGHALPVYGDGSSQRDYTYVDDIVDGIVRAWHWLQHLPSDDGTCEIFNLGGAHPVRLRDLIHQLEAALGYQANLDWQPMQPGDVPITCADVKKSQTVLGFQPQVDIETGLQHFAAWFLPRVSAASIS